MKTRACLIYFFHDCRPGPLCQLLLVLKVYWYKAYIVCNKAKGQISKRVFQENKAGHIFWKTNISYPLIRTRRCAYQCAYHGIRKIRLSEKLTCFVFLKRAYQGVRNVLLFRKFNVFSFLETPVFRFILLPYYLRFESIIALPNISFFLSSTDLSTDTWV